jgi:seryl-tRNA synthetase
MLSLDFIRKNTTQLAKAISQKNLQIDLVELLRKDAALTAAQQMLNERRSEKNRLAEAFVHLSKDERHANSQRSLEIGESIKLLERSTHTLRSDLQESLLRIPNIPWDGAPIGADETANVVIRREGVPRVFDFAPLDHVQLLEKNGWADLARVTKVCGSRTYCLKGRLALLEQALMLHVSRQMAAQGFTLLSVPAIARPQAFVNTGHFPFDLHGAFRIPEDDLYLSGTGEVVLTSLHGGEILEEDALPILYAGSSACFRREAGSAGRDVRGLIRVHQFTKVEQFVICRNEPNESAVWHQRLLENAASLLRDLELPYQIVETSTGDMGAGKFRMNDIETWIPSLGKYRETHSCSSFHDWQARRANLRYRDKQGRVQYAHTLNNTAIASPRILVPLLENHQMADGRVKLPVCLRGYFDGDDCL